MATYHGGGSASLAAYYAVTPYDGISKKLSSPPEYAIGQYSHKMLPLLGYSATSLTGQPGLTMKVYTEGPEVAGRQPVDEIEILKTEMLLFDYENPHVRSPLWYATLEGSLVADEDATWEFGLVVSGTANLYVDGELVIDNTQRQRPGDAFFGTSTVEEKGSYEFRRGRKYDVRITFGSSPTSKLSAEGMVLSGGALRVGACKVLDSRAEIARAAELARAADQVIVCAGLNADWETEGSDRADMRLPPGLDDLVAAVAAANPNTAVVVQSGTPVEMPWVGAAGAVVQAWYGGNETGNVIADVLFGDANPSGRLSLSFPRHVRDNPAFLNFRTEASRVLYGEDIYVGYRYYEFAGREVLFPFGHGLSYTTFAFSDLSVSVSVSDSDKNKNKNKNKNKDGKLIRAELKVKNTGAVDGAEVAQLYVAPVKQSARVNRPVKELKGFAKTFLAPGEAKTVAIEVEEKYAASFWDEERDQWCVEAGEYDIIVSDSSEVREDKVVRGSFKVAETYWWSGL